MDPIDDIIWAEERRLEDEILSCLDAGIM